jgi:hypothetical protein
MLIKFMSCVALLSLSSCAGFVEYHAAAGIKMDNPCKEESVKQKPVIKV